MARRSDHTRTELEALFVIEGRRLLEGVGAARFSAREVAKRVGYSIGTLYNVFGTYDAFMLALNAETLRLWAAQLRKQLAAEKHDRIAALVRGYFDFASNHPRAWSAVYEHRMADGGPAPEWYQDEAAQLMSIVVGEIAAVLPGVGIDDTVALARSLVATVHGHCAFALYMTFSMLGETDPVAAALARVRESLVAASGRADQ